MWPALTWFTSAYFLGLSNIGVLNAYSANTLQQGGDVDSKRTSSFVRISSIATFLHHSTVLTSILILSWCYEDYFYQEQFEGVILKPDTRDFYWVFAMNFLIGFYGLVLSLAMARTIVEIDIKEGTKKSTWDADIVHYHEEFYWIYKIYKNWNKTILWLRFD